MEIMDIMDSFFSDLCTVWAQLTLWTHSPLNGVQEVGGSNPLAPTIFEGCQTAALILLV